jgi:hypothetical protein
MLSPKSADITADAGSFDDTSRALWLPVLTGSALFSRAVVNFGDVKQKLAGVQSGSTQAKQLNQAMRLIDRIGPVDASTSGQEGTYATLANREGLIEYAFAVLYGQGFLPRLVMETVGVPNKAVL